MMPTVLARPLRTRPLRVALVSTYPPRRCGIATFARDLRESIEPETEVVVAALEDGGGSRDYPAEVREVIAADRFEAFVSVSDRLSAAADIVCLQHEHGIFGGEDGAHVLALAEGLRIPLVTTLHTVLQRPSPSQRSVVEALARHSARVVVINGRARAFLAESYGVPPAKVAVIPHGIPDLEFVAPETVKPLFGLQGRRVLLSFGLLSPSKGFEHAIRALPAIAAAHPDVVYVIAGNTHPGEIRERGESYRAGLQALADELGVTTHLRLIDRFLPPEELGNLLRAADVYVAPYPHEEQISSGTLAYALGSGAAVISTPFWHAQELLRDGRGVLVPFADSRAIAAEAVRLLADEQGRHRLRRQAYDESRAMTWSSVGRQYLAEFRSLSGRGQRNGRGALRATR